MAFAKRNLSLLHLLEFFEGIKKQTNNRDQAKKFSLYFQFTPSFHKLQTFKVISHQRLLNKLNSCGLQARKDLTEINNSLDIRIRLKDEFSQWKKTISGVSQGYALRL